MESDPQASGSPTAATTPPAAPAHVGERLRIAREAAGLTVQQMAEQTRIPRRHVEAIEAADLAALPGGPYPVGFARALARTLGMDEVAAADDMRTLMAQYDRPAPYVPDLYQPTDSARIPPKALAWTAAAIAMALLIAYLLWRSFLGASPDLGVGAPATTVTAPAQAQAAAPAAAIAGALSVRASNDVWFGLNDASGRLVFERTLRGGESYVLTDEQRSLLLRTGRPQNLRLLVGTRELPQLGPDDVLVKDVALDARNITARLTGAPIPATPPTQAP